MAATDGNISDVDLRRQLKTFGEDVGPVTDTTRPFLLRKLKRLQKEPRGNQSSAEKPSPRRASQSRRSLPATSTRNQSPSRKLIGFSSDEEDAGESHSRTLADSSKLRGRRREGTTTANESPGRAKSKATTPTRRSSLRPREPSFIASVPDKTLDTTDGNNGEFSDSDGQVYRRPKSRTIGISNYLRSLKRERALDETESRSDTGHPSTSYENNEQSVTADPSLHERHAGAKRVKSSSFWSSTIKILFVISAVCMAVLLLYATFKSHSSENMISADLGKNYSLLHFKCVF